GENHAGRANAALRSTMGEKGLLHGVQLIFIGQAFDGSDAGAFGLQRGDEAAVHQSAVEFDGAGPAFAFAATFFCPGEMSMLAQHVEQARHRPRFERQRASVDRATYADLPSARVLARSFSHARTPAFPAESRRLPECA